MIQRTLPRPSDINIVLRPPNTDPPLTDLQKVSITQVTKNKYIHAFSKYCRFCHLFYHGYKQCYDKAVKAGDFLFQERMTY